MATAAQNNDLAGAQTALAADRQALISVKCEPLTPAVDKLLKVIGRTTVSCTCRRVHGMKDTDATASQRRKPRPDDMTPLAIATWRLHQEILGPVSEVSLNQTDVRLAPDMKRRVEELST